MKFLKKASLAASIAAVSFAANAELVAMDEMAMAAATGQAGIDLDVTLTGANAISIGEIEYTDTNEDGQTSDGGRLAITGINIGTPSGSITLNHTIDIDADGNLNIAQSSYTEDLQISVASIDTRAAGTGTDSAANLLSNLSLVMDVAPSTTVIGSNAAGDTTIAMDGAFKIKSGSVELLNGAIGVTSLSFTGSDTVTVDGVDYTDLVTTDIDMTANASGLAVTINSLQGDLNLGGVTMGGSTVGDIAVKNLALAGASILISGHD
ncbi:hypothetical protein SAMN05421686_103336 [Thalassolituus maritimus]|uniref:DUF6160 domain-containing protein n=1 Tax=Thalassolituus maritimus TaxID=484498 RepID=A0A1N7L7J5_9GAMM|nr:DUF6160 family protein [Thalassolituus maritimus]SIS69832.1 hypothetical protein SAMN05421686_103336 [Thalassolituus maritimus]